MKPEEKENFRTSLLGVLEERASNKFGLSIQRNPPEGFSVADRNFKP